MSKDKIIFGEMHEIKEQTKSPRLIARRVGLIQAANKNKAQSAKKVTKNSKDLNHNHIKHL
ncbi:MAG: hypothetical protein IJ458_03415 [Clostridia bacterium]|nr:hypothetical protein [Clostridia bacterium]